jgi:hypothetical protein
MKKIIPLLLMSLIWSFSYSQHPQLDDIYVRGNTDSIEEIRGIDKEVALINNNLGSFKKIERSKGNDGYRYVYFKGKELKMVHVLYNDLTQEMDKDVKWYFKNGHMIYTEKTWTYPKHNNMVGSHEKCYLDNDNMIGWTQFDKPVDGNSKEFKEFAKKLKEYEKELEKEKP